MNLNTLKMGFANYLQELNEVSNKEYNTSASSDVSIFMYANEFKNYISDELNVDSSILSKGINEILNMEVVNGKLVDPNEEVNNDSFEKTEEETPEAADKTENIAEAVETDETAMIEGEEGSEETMLTDFLNELFEDETIKGILDTDESGDLSQEEIGAFLDTIKGFDGDEENISLEDVIGALQAIQDETFTLTPEDEETEIEEIEETEQPQSTPQSNGVSGSNGGSYGGGGVSGAANNAGVQEKTLDNMSKEELNSELQTAKGQLSEKQDVLNSLLDGSDSQLQSLQDAIDTAYDAYQEQLKLVDEDLAEKVDELKESIDAKQEEINEKDLEIAEQETTVSDAETAYNNAVSSRENLEATLAALKSTDTSNMSSDKSAQVSANISELEGKVEDAKKAETTAKEAWDKAQEKLEKLQEERDELETGEGGLNELNEEMTELEAIIAEKYPEIQEYMDAYNDAKDEYTEYKDTAVASAKADVQEAQKYVDEVNTAITNFDNKQTTKEYLIGDDLQAAIDWARQYDDMSQDQMRKIFADLGYQFDYDAWCADFVRMALGEAIGDENLPDWYRNCSNKAFCPTIQQAGEGHQVSAEEAQPGDIVLYDWDGDGSADHVGLFVDNGDGSSTITAIEGNTSGAGGGSCVEEKSRNRGNIIGIYSMRK